MGQSRGIVVFLTMLLVATVVGPALASPQQGETLWIVTLTEDHPSAEHAEPMAKRHGGSVRHVYEHALNGFAFEGTERAARNLERHPGVRRVTADQPVHATSDVIPWGVTRIEAPAAHTAGYEGTGTRIAVLDTGVDPDHPALDVDTELGTNCIDEGSESTVDKNGHGTHVAGSASASLVDGAFIGAATHATIVPVKVLDDTGSGSWASVACGVEYVTANAAAIRVANMSLSGSGTAGKDCTASDLRAAICNSVNAGVTYTVAAGNGGADASGSIPAAYPEVITVSALDDDRCVRLVGGGPPQTECDEGLASFSNYGPAIDVIAPGVDIYSTVPGGDYDTKSGTSMAAPHVAGVAALMLAVNDDLTPDDVRNLLQGTGECPDGVENSAVSGACEGQGQWYMDPDELAEPLVNASRAAAAVGDAPASPDPSYDEPVADFTFTCADLSCEFTDTSTHDADLQIDEWAWTFGDGATAAVESPTHAYDAGGTYDVTLTVTDTNGQSDVATKQVTVTEPASDDPEDGTIVLDVTAYKVRGLQKADLSWTGVDGEPVNVYRDHSLIHTVPAGTNSYTDETGQRGGGSYTYQVCGADTSTCSNEVTAEF